MSLLADRVKDSTTTTGTGAVTLANSAPTGYRTFASGFGAGSTTVFYCIAGQTTSEWEVGSGVFNGTTGLTRASVLASSNAGALVNFSTGTKDVFCTAPAAQLPGGSTNYTYDIPSNTLTFGSVLGSALAMTIKPKVPSSSETPGDITIQAQAPVAGNRAGGGVNIIAASGIGTGQGGGISFIAGNNLANSNVGGSVGFQAGNGNTGGNFTANAGVGTVTGGTLLFAAGDGDTTGGSADFTSGNSSGGTAGDITFQPGIGLATGGSFTVIGGATFTNIIQATDDGTNPMFAVFGVSPVTQPTTASAAATRVAGSAVSVFHTDDKYDGYTLAQVVKALRDLGFLT